MRSTFSATVIFPRIPFQTSANPPPATELGPILVTSLIIIDVGICPVPFTIFVSKRSSFRRFFNLFSNWSICGSKREGWDEEKIAKVATSWSRSIRQVCPAGEYFSIINMTKLSIEYFSRIISNILSRLGRSRIKSRPRSMSWLWSVKMNSRISSFAELVKEWTASSARLISPTIIALLAIAGKLHISVIVGRFVGMSELHLWSKPHKPSSSPLDKTSADSGRFNDIHFACERCSPVNTLALVNNDIISSGKSRRSAYFQTHRSEVIDIAFRGRVALCCLRFWDTPACP